MKTLKDLVIVNKAKILAAKTKYSMAYWMDVYHYRSLPWLHMMSLTKVEMKQEFDSFLRSFDLIKS